MDPSSIIDVVAQEQTQRSAQEEEQRLEPYPTDPWANTSPAKALGVMTAVAGGLMGLIWLFGRKRRAVVPVTPMAAQLPTMAPVVDQASVPPSPAAAGSQVGSQSIMFGDASANVRR